MQNIWIGICCIEVIDGVHVRLWVNGKMKVRCVIWGNREWIGNVSIMKLGKYTGITGLCVNVTISRKLINKY